MYQNIQQIERSIQERSQADKPLINFWLSSFVLSWLTLGIFPIILYFQKLGRIDRFLRRKKSYYDAVIALTANKISDMESSEQQQQMLEDLKKLYHNQFLTIKEMNAGVSLLLSIVTLGLWGIFVLYRQNKIWDELQTFEAAFDDKLSKIWNTIGICKYPITFTVDGSKKRNFLLNLLATLGTFGFWGIVWNYKIHTDPDQLYPAFHNAEDAVLQAVRA